MQASLCILLGAVLNINKESDQTNADKANNITLVLNVVIVAVNIIINVFEMKDTQDTIG